ncbi:antibiotic biosynthesis monooxygenase [Crossiella sp. SN42]|uniref:antibiotic biosynthesis monooxygenase family protein n=1 Tax=Crossiella sp. SN42 TaxID=2944808 RepID=UPI00207C1DA9|nr:antibiotic biosynthesis monooxygenase [Crossiella sp. SN42]MCO1580339.1 antibiotic biosynthesis monooxygenase [Crossiella sp. SN42]
MSARARVLLFAAAERPQDVVAAYHRISQDLDGTPGLLGNELLREVSAPAGRFVVISEWASLAAFQDWERGSAHRDTTAPLRPYQDTSRGRFGVYEVLAGYGGEGRS